MKKTFFALCAALCSFMFFSCGSDSKGKSPELVERKFYGTLARVHVTSDYAYAMSDQSFFSKRIQKLEKDQTLEIKGFSDKKINIFGYKGYWLKVSTSPNPVYPDDYTGTYGWVFSAFTDMDTSIEVSTLTPVKLLYNSNNEVNGLELEIDRQGKKAISYVELNKFNWQKEYSFAWSDDLQGFWFCDPCGTFKYNPETNQITHITHIGWACESKGSIASDDGAYVFQDSGTGPGLRGLQVCNTKTSKVIYKGYYLTDFHYDGKSITVAEPFDSDSNFSSEILKQVEEFRNTLQQDNFTSYTVIVLFKIDLKSGKKTFYRCDYKML
jgi:hypothetical protein